MTIILAAVFTITPVPKDIQNRMVGVSYPAEAVEGLPAMDDLRYLRLSYWNYDGKECVGEMVCHKTIAKDVEEIFHALYDMKYPIKSIRLIDEYKGSDDDSIADDNTSCFNFRPIVGSKKLSSHALGMAVDINPLENPYVKGDKVLPPAGRDYLDRPSDPEVACRRHILIDGDPCVALFKAHGFEWGGDWHSLKDYQHFEKRTDRQ